MADGVFHAIVAGIAAGLRAAAIAAAAGEELVRGGDEVVADVVAGERI